ncbi:MAG: alanine--tRNA ligase [Gammaproteobacteria bacterium]|nr:alanine--tRNA ligase [Gammaproteobacteria bacterium]
MKSAQIRSAFLKFFADRGHDAAPSSPLVPGNDPTLLFTNAGMVQFKDVFLGLEDRDSRRAVTSQRCVRAGGKHNDLENVGYTARHHTFFEMLGNFSFGDYFKDEAIAWAWELLTGEFGLPPEKLWVTVYNDDDEAAKIWLEDIGVDPARFSRCGEEDNFWSMGDVGPCGPCTEVFYDHGPDIPGGPPGSADADGDRYVEIWNLVFMQYNRTRDGKMEPIPKPSVDTGMGLERIAAVLQGVHSNYDIDLFRNLIAAIHELLGRDDVNRQSTQVIADHIRACAFLIMDGVLPSNEGRGYVLRRIIRRAVRHGNRLGFEDAFFHRLVPALVREMGEAYPELAGAQGRVTDALAAEEARFSETLRQGMAVLDDAVAGLGDGSAAGAGELPGNVAFQLYDTYGFPVDLTADVLRERGLGIDMAGFETAMQAQRDRARAASQFAADEHAEAIPAAELAGLAAASSFTGYDGTQNPATIIGLYAGGRRLEELEAGQSGVLVLDATPFYAESGGQVGDRGGIRTSDGVFEVEDTQKQSGIHVHIGRVAMGRIASGARAEAEVEDERRAATRRNHSATHLLHAALREVLGTHVAQKGSLVDHERTRFDFSHPQPVTVEELERIESIVNAEIRRNVAVEAAVMPYQQAIDAGAMALFGEKYGDEVRVLSMGAFSVELCGGTHVDRTGDIGLFRIASEGGVASGVRRIEAVTGVGALALVRDREATLRRVAALVKTDLNAVESRVEQLAERLKSQEKENQQLKARLAGGGSRDLAADARGVGDLKVLGARLDGADVPALRTAVDQLKDKLDPAAVVLGTVEDGKVRLVAGVSKGGTDRIKAGELVNFVAGQVGGKGGGRPDMAQAGGTEPDNLDAALASVYEWVAGQLA